MRPQAVSGSLDIRSPERLFQDVGLFIIESRCPDSAADRGHVTGTHFPSFPVMKGGVSASSKTSSCCQGNTDQCDVTTERLEVMSRLWRNQIPMAIEVLLLPDCTHGSRALRGPVCAPPKLRGALLLERWTIQTQLKRNVARSPDVTQLLRMLQSHLYFSQLSSWLSNSKGRTPKHVYYRISAPGDFSTTQFSEQPTDHAFPEVVIANNLCFKISVSCLPRRPEPRVVSCPLCKDPPTQHTDEQTPAKVAPPTPPAVRTPADSKTTIAFTQTSKSFSAGKYEENGADKRTRVVRPTNIKITCDTTEETSLDDTVDVAGGLQQSPEFVRRKEVVRPPLRSPIGVMPTADQTNRPLTSPKVLLSSMTSRHVSSSFRSAASLTFSSSRETEVDVKPEVPSPSDDLNERMCTLSFIDEGRRRSTGNTCLSVRSKVGVSKLCSSKEGVSTAVCSSTEGVADDAVCLSEQNCLATDVRVSAEDTINVCSSNGACVGGVSTTVCSSSRVASDSVPMDIQTPVPKVRPTFHLQGEKRDATPPLLPCKRPKHSESQEDMQTPEHTDIQTQGHTDIKTPGHTDIQTPGHTDIKTPGHTDVQTRSDIQTPKPADAQSDCIGFEVATSGQKVAQKSDHPEKLAGEQEGKRAAEEDLHTEEQPVTELSEGKTTVHLDSSSSIDECVEVGVSSKDVCLSDQNGSSEDTTDDQADDCKPDKQIPGKSPPRPIESANQSSQNGHVIDMYNKLFSADVASNGAVCTESACVTRSCEHVTNIVSSVSPPKSLVTKLSLRKHRTEPAVSSSVTSLSPRLSEPTLSRGLSCDLSADRPSLPIRSPSDCMPPPSPSVTGLFMKSKALLKGLLASKKEPTAQQKETFQKQTSQCAKSLFKTSGLPLQSSPAPMKKNLSGAFDFDSSLVNNTRAIKKVISCSGLNEICVGGDDVSSPRDRKPLSRSAPSLTSNCLLGNFEESMLNGRLEPQGVVDGFSASLGASGTFHPAHVRLPVTAFFFNLSENIAASPYLGHIDLSEAGKRGYHLPTKGTVQLTLFNPNKTVVKMFVVKYDLTDMPPRSHTFLRHRTLYVPQSNTTQLPSFLRYLIHLRFQTSKSGKLYLHSDIRLIFARDRFEFDRRVASYELQSHTQSPQNPKYSPVK